MEWEFKYFKPKELLSPDGLDAMKTHGWVRVQKFAIEALTDWRIWADVPISVNFAQNVRRGYRSENENKAVKGAPNSAHTQGMAFDQTPHNYPLFDYYIQAIYWSYLRHKAGLQAYNALGIYPQNNFVHGDFRFNSSPLLVLWNGYGKKLLTKAVEFDTLPLEDLPNFLVKELALPEWKLSRITMADILKRTL